MLPTEVAKWKGAFADADSHPIVLCLMLLRAYGPEYLAWEPETIWHENQLTFGVATSETNRQKIQAVRSIYVSDLPGSDWVAFEKVAAGLAGFAPRPDISQRCPPARAGMALECMLYVRDPQYIKPEVYRYCAACMMDFGIVYAPGVLEEANQYVADADPALQNQVRGGVARGRAITQNIELQTQIEKSLAVRESLREMHTHFVEQVRRYGL